MLKDKDDKGDVIVVFVSNNGMDKVELINRSRSYKYPVTIGATDTYGTHFLMSFESVEALNNFAEQFNKIATGIEQEIEEVNSEQVPESDRRNDNID